MNISMKEYYILRFCVAVNDTALQKTAVHLNLKIPRSWKLQGLTSRFKSW